MISAANIAAPQAVAANIGLFTCSIAVSTRRRSSSGMPARAATRPVRYVRSSLMISPRENVLPITRVISARGSSVGRGCGSSSCRVAISRAVGLQRTRRANWKHGRFSREAKAERSRVRAAIRALRYLCIMEGFSEKSGDVVSFFMLFRSCSAAHSAYSCSMDFGTAQLAPARARAPPAAVEQVFLVGKRLTRAGLRSKAQRHSEMDLLTAIASAVLQCRAGRGRYCPCGSRDP